MFMISKLIRKQNSIKIFNQNKISIRNHMSDSELEELAKKDVDENGMWKGAV